MSLSRVGPSADTSALLLAAGAHNWSYKAIEKYKKDFEEQERLRDMPPLWQRLGGIHPRLPTAILYSAYTATALALLATFALSHPNSATHPALNFLVAATATLAVLTMWLMSQLAPTQFYRWESLLPEAYLRQYGALPPEVRQVMGNARAFWPDCVFRIEVLEKDPILWIDGLGEGELSRPLRVWNLDGTHVLPPPT